jgi:hypothetical protein
MEMLFENVADIYTQGGLFGNALAGTFISRVREDS